MWRWGTRVPSPALVLIVNSPKRGSSLLQKNFQKHYRKAYPGNLVPTLNANGVVTGRAKPKSSKKTTRTLTPSSGANGTEGARVSDSQGKLCTSPLRIPPLAAKGWVTCDVSRGDSDRCPYMTITVRSRGQIETHESSCLPMVQQHTERVGKIAEWPERSITPIL